MSDTPLGEVSSASHDVRPRICFVASTPFVITAFLRDHFVELSKSYDITVLTALKDSTYILEVPSCITVEHIDIQRNISLLKDAAALCSLFQVFYRERFDAVHSITPKGGLLAMTSAFFARIPKRIHVFTGQVWATKSGFMRSLLKCADMLIAMFATHLLADSQSQLKFLVSEGIVRSDRIRVLANGSMAGVDLIRFHASVLIRQRVRAELGIAEGAIVILFVGRLKREKGVLDLLNAWGHISLIRPNCHLILVGPDEERISASVPNSERCHAIGYTLQVERYMVAADIFALPSHREGFGSVLLEAAACGLPVVASNIYGITDAMVDGMTGLLHTPQDTSDLSQKLLMLIDDQRLRHQFGNAGQTWVSNNFPREFVVRSMVRFYEQILGERKNLSR